MGLELSHLDSGNMHAEALGDGGVVCSGGGCVHLHSPTSLLLDMGFGYL